MHVVFFNSDYFLRDANCTILHECFTVYDWSTVYVSVKENSGHPIQLKAR